MSPTATVLQQRPENTTSAASVTPELAEAIADASAAGEAASKRVFERELEGIRIENSREVDERARRARDRDRVEYPTVDWRERGRAVRDYEARAQAPGRGHFKLIGSHAIETVQHAGGTMREQRTFSCPEGGRHHALTARRGSAAHAVYAWQQPYPTT